MSVAKARGQWLPEINVFDLNPDKRRQAKKYGAAIPAVDLLVDWIEATDEWFICGERNAGTKKVPRWSQYRVMSVRSAWDSARQELGIPDAWGPKLLRHSMATILANRRVP